MEPTNKYNRPIRHLPEYQGHLNDRCVTIAEVLRAAGYQTFMAGKWHVGSAEGQRPLDRGFDRFFGLYGGASNFFRPREGQIVDQDKPFWPLPKDFYTTDYFAKYAAKFIAEADHDRPFFLYLAFTAPHWPLHAWPEDIAKYRGKYRIGWDALRAQRFAAQKRLGLFSQPTQLTARHKDSYDWSVADQGDMDLRMAVYAAMIDRMDQGVGQVLQALRDFGRESNTLIFVLSDNGGCAEPLGKDKPNAKPPGPADSFTGYFLPWANASNTPFRLFKHWVHEGGIATPLIVSWPTGSATRQRGNQLGGGLCHVPAHVIDIMATCVDVADADYLRQLGGKPIHPPEGQSLRPLFSSSPDLAAPFMQRTLFWEHEGNRAVRVGRWKLVSYYNEIHEEMRRVGTGRRTGRWELYDLEIDRTEQSDLARENPDKVQELSAKFRIWANRVGARDWQALLRIGGFDDNGNSTVTENQR
jgi:arylsulfatase